MLSTKNKIQLVSVLLNDIKNDVANYQKDSVLENIAILNDENSFSLFVKDSNNDIILTFDEKGNIITTSKNEENNKTIRRKYLINCII